MLANAERSEAGDDTPPTEWRIARVRRCGLAAGSFIVALNKISGRWDIDKLSVIMEELVTEGLAGLTGHSDAEIRRLTLQAEQAINADGELNADKFTEEAFQNKCPRCGFLY